jgi:hypothetical protein
MVPWRLHEQQAVRILEFVRRLDVGRWPSSVNGSSS